MIRSRGLQRRRLLFQGGFFLLFLLAPPLDIFRFDLTRGHFIFFGFPWGLGIDSLIRGEVGPAAAGLNLILRGFIPLLLLVGGFIFVAWRYGRLYCGWLCPHFSVVEMINHLMVRAGGRPTLWELEQLPLKGVDGTSLRPKRGYWPLAWFAALFLAFTWAVAMLTYLLPPAEVYHNILNGTPTPNQFRFLLIVTSVLFIDFMFARHLFCRFGCAAGLFQSLAWMGNDRGLVVGMERERAGLCRGCNNACDNVCPMRLKPRTIKRRMFTCTECALCITACEEVQEGGRPLLKWVDGDQAVVVAKGRPPMGEERQNGSAPRPESD